MVRERDAISVEQSLENTRLTQLRYRTINFKGWHTVLKVIFAVRAHTGMRAHLAAYHEVGAMNNKHKTGATVFTSWHPSTQER